MEKAGQQDSLGVLSLTGYIQWMMVNFCVPVFLDFWLIQRKAKSRRFIILERRDTPGWMRVQSLMKDYALPESICSDGIASFVCLMAEEQRVNALLMTLLNIQRRNAKCSKKELKRRIFDLELMAKTTEAGCPILYSTLSAASRLWPWFWPYFLFVFHITVLGVLFSDCCGGADGPAGLDHMDQRPVCLWRRRDHGTGSPGRSLIWTMTARAVS